MTTNTWQQFINDLDDYLYANGWYSKGNAIRDRINSGKITEGNYEQIVSYLTEHCYERSESELIVDRLLHHER